MSDLNVDVKRTFGEFLPISFIKKIDVLPGAGDPEKWSEIEISVDVNFTVNSDIKNYKDLIVNNLNDLYLYIAFIKSAGRHFLDLENNSLSLKHDIFEHNASITNPMVGIVRTGLASEGISLTHSEVKRSLKYQFKKVALSSLKSRIVEEGLFDINGDRILKISNIKFRTKFVNVMMAQFPAAGFVTFVGRDDKTLKNKPDAIYSRNFGDLSYELSLVKNVVPTTTQAVFVDIDSNQVTATPLRTIGGSYYEPDPITHDEIARNFVDLTNAYVEAGDVSPALYSSLTNLHHLLVINHNSIALIPELNLYRKSFPDKSNATSAGRFYNLFKRRLLSWNRRVSQQKRLYKRLVLNSKTSDRRGIDEKTYSMLEPNPDPSSLPTGPGYNYFINDHLTKISRTTQLTVPLPGALSDYVQFVAEEGIEDADDALGMWNKTYDQLFAASLRETYDFTHVEPDYAPITGWQSVPNRYSPLTEPDTVVKNKGIFFFDYERALHTKSAIAKVFMVHRLYATLGLHVPYDFFRLANTGAAVVRAEYLFKTQNTDTSLWNDDPLMFTNETYDPWDNEKPLNVAGPYIGTPYADDQAVVTIEAIFDTGKNYPAQFSSHWKIDCWNHESYLAYGMPYVYKYIFGAQDFLGTASDSASTVQDPGHLNKANMQSSPYSDPGSESTETLGMVPTINGMYNVPEHAEIHMKTVADGANVQTRATSYLKLKNFDLPYASKALRLEGYNGSKVKGGYRLMCFEFQDFMDDDVAYYNTTGIAWGDRDEDKMHTKYDFHVAIDDASLNLYYKVLNILETEYMRFITYYEQAKAICSYNNIDDVFNEFFITAMSDYEGTYGIVAPWYSSPVIYYSFLALLTDMYSLVSLDDLRGHIENDASVTAGRISPMSGRMSDLEDFKTLFDHLLGMFASKLVPVENRGPHDSEVYKLFLAAGGPEYGSSTPVPVYSQTYSQRHKLDEEIFGNLYLSAWNVDDIDIGDLNTLEYEEVVPEGGLDLGSDFYDADWPLKGIDLKFVKGGYGNNDTRKIYIFAGDCSSRGTGSGTGLMIGTSGDVGSIHGAMHDWLSNTGDWPEGVVWGGYPPGIDAPLTFSEEGGESQTVYLPPGTWSILGTHAGDDRIQIAMNIRVEPRADSVNRVKRSSGAGWEYTQNGIGPAGFTWHIRNGCGDGWETSDTRAWVYRYSSRAPHCGQTDPNASGFSYPYWTKSGLDSEERTFSIHVAEFNADAAASSYLHIRDAECPGSYGAASWDGWISSLLWTTLGPYSWLNCHPT